MFGLLFLSQFAAAGTTVSAGVYGGGAFMGPEHELYQDPVAEHHTLSPGLVLGGRAALMPLQFLGGEGEFHVGAASVADSGATALLAWRLHGVVRTPEPVFEGVTPLFVAGLGDRMVASAADALGRDVDWAAHLGPGAMIETAGPTLRADLRLLMGPKRLRSTTPSTSVEALVGLHWEFGDKTPERVLEVADVAPEPVATAELLVSIRDEQGLPVSDAEITVAGSIVGTTDADGRVQIEGYSVGESLALVAQHSHTTAADGAIDAMVSGENPLALTVAWNPGSVRVLATGPSGPMDASVTATQGEAKEAWTVGAGQGDVAELAPGDWQLLVQADGMGIQTADITIQADETSLVQVKLTLEKAQVEVTEEAIEILARVQFASGSSNVLKSSMKLLEEVSNTLKAHASIRRVEVAGHTDSQGSDASNQALSQRRVDEVVRLLVASGIDAGRLVAKGYGESKPIDSNDTQAGREQNRRVVFQILERSD